VNAQVQSQLSIATANIPAQVANSAAAAASARLQSQQAAAAAAAAASSAQAQAASAEAQAAANAASAAAAAGAAKTVAHGAGQGAATGVTQTVMNVPAVTLANNNPSALQTTADSPVAAATGRVESTLNTQIIIPTVVVPTAQLSVVPGSGQIISKLPDGSVVTISGVSVTLSSSVVTDNTLTGVQSATGSDGPQDPKTTLIGNSDIRGQNIHTTTGLPKRAYIGIGVGFGLLALLIVFVVIWFQRNHQKQKKKKKDPNHERSPSLDPSATNQGSGERHGIAESALREVAPVDNSDARTAELESAHHTSTGSFRSPVSPFSSIAAQSSISPNGSPTIYELIGSAPAEMVDSSASPSGGVEMQGSPAAEEVPGSTPNLDVKIQVSVTSVSPIAPTLEQGKGPSTGNDRSEKKQRPFSFISSPTAEQFLSPNRGPKN
jgi:hypothetical protein